MNPYQAPDAPISEDFILIEPRRRSLTSLVVAVFYLTFGLMLASAEIGIVIAITQKWSRAGTKWENHPAQLGWGEFIIFPLAASAVCFLRSGQLFWVVENRRAVRWTYAALGFVALTILPPLVGWLFR